MPDVPRFHSIDLDEVDAREAVDIPDPCWLGLIDESGAEVRKAGYRRVKFSSAMACEKDVMWGVADESWGVIEELGFYAAEFGGEPIATIGFDGEMVELGDTPGFNVNALLDAIARNNCVEWATDDGWTRAVNTLSHDLVS